MNISQRIDALPMTPLMRKVLLFTGIGWLFDAMDNGIISGVIASSIGADWGLDKLDLSILASAGILGMIIGAALSGVASDRWGRRFVIVFTLVLFSIGSLLSGLSFSYNMLLVARFITGLGLGGELPAASTLVSEFSPLAKRGRNVVILESFWAWGWIAAALISYLAIPELGWRAAFIIGGIPALFAAILRFAVPESPRYLAQKGKTAQAEVIVSKMEKQAEQLAQKSKLTQANALATKVKKQAQRPSFAVAIACGVISFIARVAAPAKRRTEGAVTTTKESSKLTVLRLWSREHIRATAVIWLVWFGINFGYYGFVLWTPSLLIAQGFELTKSLQFVLLMCFAQLPGYLAAAMLIERIGRKPVLVIFMLGTAVAAWLFGHAASTTEILAYGCLLYFFALGAWGCVYSYTPELYPTKIRGEGVGWAASFGRVGAFLAPFIVPAVHSFYGAEAGFLVVFLLLTAVFITVAVVVGIFGIETKAKPIQ